MNRSIILTLLFVAGSSSTTFAQPTRVYPQPRKPITTWEGLSYIPKEKTPEKTTGLKKLGAERYGVDISPNGQLLVGGDGILWNLKTGQDELQFPGEHQTGGFSRKGTFLLTTYEELFFELPALSPPVRATVWNLKTFEPVAKIDLGSHTSVEACVYSRDEKYLLIASRYRPTQLWDLTKGEKVASYETSPEKNGLAFSEKGGLFAPGFAPSLTVWNRKTLKPVFRLDPPMGVLFTTVTFTPDGERVIVGDSKGRVAVWDIASGKEVLTIKAHEWLISHAIILADGKQLLTAATKGTNNWEPNYSTAPDRTVKIWDLETGEFQRAFQHDGPLFVNRFHGVQLNADGSRLLTTSIRPTTTKWSGTGPRDVILWDTTTGNELLRVEMPSGDLADGILSRNGKHVFTYGAGNKLWDGETGELIREYQ